MRLTPLQADDRAEVSLGLLEHAWDLHAVTTGYETPWSQRDVDAHMVRVLEAHDAGSAYTFGIRIDDRLVGVVELLDVKDIHRRARVGIAIWSPDDRGQGTGGDAVGQVVDIAFGRLGLSRLWATILATNHGSLRVFEKHGFVEEGRLPAHVWLAGAFHDVCVLGMASDARR